MAYNDKYRALVDRLEAQARQSPGSYRFKLALLAGLGFAVLGGSVLGALALSLGLLVALVAINPLLLLKLIKVIWLPIAFGGVILNALWVHFPLPRGYRLRKHQAPELRAEIERLRKATGAPKLAGIIIDNDLNAGAASLPKSLGLFGHRHYLVLGLPLMQMLSREQFAAVVAHEFGHFGGRHGHFNGWIYRVRASWSHVLDGLTRQKSPVAGAFVSFFNWYAPYFNAYSFALARSNEYDADATSARVVNPQAAGEALIRSQLGAQRLHRDFWPSLHDSARLSPEPPASLFRDLGQALRSAGEDDVTRLAAVLEQPGDPADTHPGLALRLAALGVAAHVPPPPDHAAAEALLGDMLPALENLFSEEWRGIYGDRWQQAHREHLQARTRLEALDAQPTLTPIEVLEQARLIELLRTPEEAIARYRDALALEEQPFGHFRLGSLLLAQDDAAGIAHLRRAVELDFNAGEGAIEHLVAHFQRTDTPLEQGQAVLEEIKAMWDRGHAAAAARETLTAKDRFDPHGLDERTVQALVATAGAIPGLTRLWVARKRIELDPDGPPHWVLVAKWKQGAVQQNSRLQDAVTQLDRLSSFGVFSANDGGQITKRAAKAAGKPVFAKGWW